MDPGKKPEAIRLAPGRAQALSDPPQIVRIEQLFFHLLPDRLDPVRARRSQQAGRRRIVPRVIQPRQRGSIARHEVRKQFGHNREA